MMRGVISSVVASVFLLALLSSASGLKKIAPDYSCHQVADAHLQRVALQQAFSDALSDAAQKALALSIASGSGAGAQERVKTAMYLAALDFEGQAREKGMDVLFWCGMPSEGARQSASVAMEAIGRAKLPQGALALLSPACAESFDANLLRGSLRAHGVGFSFYLPKSGIGYAHALPDGFEAGIGGKEGG